MDTCDISSALENLDFVSTVPALAGNIVLCSWARLFTLTLPLSIQVQVMANLTL